MGAIRLAGGCSASLVSKRGLVMTNHHCLRDCISDLSSPEHDYLENGFVAATDAEERRCPRIEANQLVAIADVTDRVLGAAKGLEGAAYGQAMKQEMTRIEGTCATSAAVRCEVVTLFHGGKYHLYTYRRFQDVRLVAAPEFPMAVFGGYPDNFNFPRYGFDVGFLRLYENDKPVATPDALPWAGTPAKEGDLTFVAGNPGGTERVQTVEQLAYQRDVALPRTMVRLSELRGTLLAVHAGEPRPLAGDAGADPHGGERAEGAHRSPGVPGGPGRLRAQAGRGCSAARGGAGPTRPRRRGTGRPGRPSAAPSMPSGGCRPATSWRRRARGSARSCSRPPGCWCAPRPSGPSRPPSGCGSSPMPGFPPSASTCSATPRSPVRWRRTTLTVGLRRLRDMLGPDDPYVQAVLGKNAPEDLAKEAVEGTHLDEAKVRDALWEGGQAAVAASTDPMIVLARRADPDARAIRKQVEDEVEAVLARNGELLHQAHVAVHGTSGYPDATFTLRLSYGTIAGWEAGGRKVPAMTFVSGLFARDTGKYPFAVVPGVARAHGRSWTPTCPSTWPPPTTSSAATPARR